jgi:hypothetical protein
LSSLILNLILTLSLTLTFTLTLTTMISSPTEAQEHQINDSDNVFSTEKKVAKKVTFKEQDFSDQDDDLFTDLNLIGENQHTKKVQQIKASQKSANDHKIGALDIIGSLNPVVMVFKVVSALAQKNKDKIVGKISSESQYDDQEDNTERGVVTSTNDLCAQATHGGDSKWKYKELEINYYK